MAAPDEVFVLDFMTQKAIVSKHGTLSLIDGTPQSRWTVRRGANTKTFDVVITEDEFRKIWDAIHDHPEIELFRVKSPDVQLDFTTHYVVGLVFSLAGRRSVATYLIPHAASGVATEWARDIEALAGE